MSTEPSPSGYSRSVLALLFLIACGLWLISLNACTDPVRPPDPCLTYDLKIEVKLYYTTTGVADSTKVSIPPCRRIK